MLTCMRYMRSRSSSPMTSLRRGLRAAPGGTIANRPGAAHPLKQAFHLALAVEHVEPRGDHDRRTGKRPSGRYVREHEVAEQDYPDELGVDEGREQRGGREPVRGDQ